MQRFVAVVLSCALALTGCSRTTAKVGIGAGLGLVVIGVGMRAGVLGHGGETDPEDVAFIPIVGGLLFAATSALALAIITDDDKSEPAPQAPPPSPPAPDPELDRGERRSAGELETQAKATARAGNCQAARRLTDQIRTLDPERHASLLRDSAIARCMQSP